MSLEDLKRQVRAISAKYADREQRARRLAHHSFEAALWDDAAHFCRLAGCRAATLSAYKEAASLFRNALAALANTAESAERQRQKIDLQIELRHALFPTGGFAEIGSVLAKAHEEAEALGDKARLGLVLMHETTHHLGAGRHQEAVQAGIRALAIADELEDNSTRRDILFHLVQANASSGAASSPGTEGGLLALLRHAEAISLCPMFRGGSEVTGNRPKPPVNIYAFAPPRLPSTI